MEDQGFLGNRQRDVLISSGAFTPIDKRELIDGPLSDFQTRAP